MGSDLKAPRPIYSGFANLVNANLFLHHYSTITIDVEALAQSSWAEVEV